MSDTQISVADTDDGRKQLIMAVTLDKEDAAKIAGLLVAKAPAKKRAAKKTAAPRRGGRK